MQQNIKRKRVAILISGRGSNMETLIQACEAKGFPAEIVLVISNRPNAAGLIFAEKRNIPVMIVDHKKFTSRAAFEDVMNIGLLEAKIDLICNAGFMRLLTKKFVEFWQDKQLNIHPSLLPSFKGLHTHERALKRGVKLVGCTVHFVREQMDTGPIIAQAAVPVLPNDTVKTLADRVLKAEHQLYPEALKLVASEQVFVKNDVALILP